MEIQFSPVEIRIIGTLIEKQITTPEYYPLTLNALVNGCNQKSNRSPVMSLTEDEVFKALYNLQILRMVQKLLLSNSRSERYKHLFDERFILTMEEKVILCELFIRGAQTPGELRTRTERMYPITSLDDVQKALDALAGRAEAPYIVKLERQPGQKECRYAHLFCGQPELPAAGESQPAADTVSLQAGKSRLEQLEEQVALLTRDMQQLKGQVSKLEEGGSAK